MAFTSDQTTLNLTTVGADTLARTGRTRVTSIQGEGIATATIILYVCMTQAMLQVQVLQ